MIKIDGSQGEGGGQVLRTSLALSMVTGQPFRIERIRAGRPKPGLMRQHLTSVQAACAVCGGAAAGAELGSSELEFVPSQVRGGEYSFAIGSAGSTTLVLQTVLPALIIAREPSTIVLSGGTHNTYAPSVHFLRRAFLPLVERMGPSVRIDLRRHGFYPAGGGEIRVEIVPVAQLRPIELLACTPVKSRRATATVAGLSPGIAERELGIVATKLDWPEQDLRVERLSDAVGPGNILSIEIERADVTEVFTGFGERGVAAERVAATTVREVKRYLAADVPVWKHLADQLMVPLALAGGGAFTTGPLTRHAFTNAEVIESFLDIKVHRNEVDENRCQVRMLK